MTAWEEIKALHRQSTFGAKEGLAFRYFSRPLASFILYFIKGGRITPNQVTILSLLTGVAGSVVHVTCWSWWGLMAGGALFMLAHVLDALDGQLARYRKAGSTIGMYFDFFIDEAKAYLMYVALGLRLFFQLAVARGSGRLPVATEGGSDFASPTWLLDALAESGDLPGWWMVPWLLVGLMGLATGISCTQFLKRSEWKAAFPTSAGSQKPGGLIGFIESVGHFVVDYPSYIILLCLINRVDIYILAYTVVVCAYALRALFGISQKLWRINPYAPQIPDSAPESRKSSS